MVGYIGAKMRIFDQQGDDDYAVICVDDAYTQEICTQISARNKQQIIPVSVGKALGRGIYVIDGVLYDGIARPTTEISDLREALALPGSHNWQNAAAALAAARILIADSKGLGQAILSFPGLAHRLEDVGRIGNVRFINDSKATNAEAALCALSAFDNVYWIVGGQSKKEGIASLKGQLAPVVKAYMIGQSAEAFSRTLNGEVNHEISGELKDAVATATRDALASGTQDAVVLLSPACASFDQFSNFEDRGNAFRDIVATLKANQGTQSTSQGESAA
jgi:UDP-N-acetylmuramoylalanine--D-glutamate ligase